MGFLRQDVKLTQSKALPNGAASVNSTGFDLGLGPQGDFLAEVELKVSAPALAVGELANGDTMTYIVQHDTASDFSGATTLFDNLIVQTGAGGVGAAAATATVSLPVDVKRYVRIKATNSGLGNASAKSLTEELLF